MAETAVVSRFSDALSEAISELDGLVERDADALSDAELSALVVELERERARLAGLQARVVSRWDARKVWALDKARSAAAWLAHRARIAKRDAARRVRLARALREMPETDQALRAGEISESHAERLGRARRHREAVFARDEPLLAGHARSLSFRDYERAVSYWEQLADPDGSEADAANQLDRRRLHLSQTIGGAWALDGWADPIRGTIIHQELTRLERELFRADWQAAKALHGDNVSIELLERTPAQRRLDALVEMATRSATSPADGQQPRPLFTVLVDYPATFERVCELANGTPVTPGQLAPHITRADIERVVYDGPSRILDVGVTQRFFRGATRRALEVRDRTCQHEGCDEPAENCEADHRWPHHRGGPTIQTNGLMFCPPHHPHDDDPDRQHYRPRPPPDHE